MARIRRAQRQRHRAQCTIHSLARGRLRRRQLHVPAARAQQAHVRVRVRLFHRRRPAGQGQSGL